LQYTVMNELKLKMTKNELIPPRRDGILSF
jgi:hypothetical protein